MNKITTMWLLYAATAISGCASLPASGPSGADVLQIEETVAISDLGINLIEIDAATVGALGELQAEKIFPALELPVGPRSATAQPGDTILLKIWESDPEGVFATGASSQAPIEVSVAEDGSIFVPFAGEVHIADKTAGGVREALMSALIGKAIDPQVQVVFKRSSENSISISGGVSQPGQYPVGVSPLSLLQAISAAGGSRTRQFETRVDILRNGRTNSIVLSDVFKDPRNNIRLAPGDIVELSEIPRTFTAFGAITRRGQHDFDREKLSLEQAIAQSGGLMENLSDASGVFLFRLESATRVASAGVTGDNDQAEIPIIYRLDMSNPESFFLARQFEIQDNDILYVSAAPAVEFSKFISTVVAPTLNPTRTIKTLSE